MGITETRGSFPRGNLWKNWIYGVRKKQTSNVVDAGQEREFNARKAFRWYWGHCEGRLQVIVTQPMSLTMIRFQLLSPEEKKSNKQRQSGRSGRELLSRES